MSAPRISVLLPCFNDGHWIDEAIGSVRQQTFQDFEIVIVDDGSTDAATVQKLASIDEADTRVFRTENRGLPAARTHGAAQARGELFCALDADDRLAPAWFEKAVQLLTARPDLAFVSHWLETFGDEHWTWTPERCDLPALLARNTVNGAALVRRIAFTAVNGYDESMRRGCEDWDLWLRLVEAGHHGAIIPEVLFYYRRRSASMSRVMTASAEYRRPLELLLDKHDHFYRDHLIEVVVDKEAERRTLADEIDALEADRLMDLEPALARAGEELEALRSRERKARRLQAERDERARLAQQVSDLHHEVAALQQRVQALHESWSWRVTRPLRWLYTQVTRSDW